MSCGSSWAGWLSSSAGLAPWSSLAAANLRFAPTLPWAVVLGAAYLLLLWRFLGGKGWPRYGADARRHRLRANPVGRDALRSCAVAGGLYAGALFALTYAGWTLLGLPESARRELAALGAHDAWMVVPALLMAAVFAGVVEEAAFRGYIQGPLEERFGALAAIVGTAALYTLAHFPPPLLLPLFLVAASGWGLLAHTTNSILPGIVLHTLVDAVSWLWLWTRREQLDAIFGPYGTGAHGWTLAGALGVALLLSLGAVYWFRRLWRLTQKTGGDGLRRVRP